MQEIPGFDSAKLETIIVRTTEEALQVDGFLCFGALQPGARLRACLQSF